MAQTTFDPTPLRAQFPALSLTLDGYPAVFFDNPGGTQVPQTVIEAVADYYRGSNANVGGAFATSRRTDSVVAGAREAMADLLNAPGPETIVFGPSMTALTFHLARSLAHTIEPGDEIIVTTLDHDANVTPWTDLEAAGAIIRVVDIHPEDSTLDMDGLQAALSPRTRLVAVTAASNAVGTIPDVARVIKMAHDVGALVFVDAVQFAPHAPIDVQALDCDFLACSAYKFFGPHMGILYGKAEHLTRLTPHKVKPSKDAIPYRWELGTLNHEGLAGVAAAVDYLASIGGLFGEPNSGRRLMLKTAMRAIREYEKSLSRRLLEGLAGVGDITVYGLTDMGRLDERLPTVAFTWPRLTPRATAEYLAAQGFCVWSGNYYALRLMERLGLEEQGGAVRVGLAHYNTAEEIDRLIAALQDVPKASA
jgi:cysteine desulfurase family protein (TIGR01976 family)